MMADILLNFANGVDSSISQPTRFAEYWFSDGSIILQAESTMFRVHLSVLARHSEVFKDMSSVPQPTGQSQDAVIEGCPVITVSDSAQDIEVLLSVLYDPLRVYNLRKPVPMRVLSAMLRLGRKYGMKHLEQEAIERLEVDFPTSLKEWNTHFEKNKGSRSFRLLDCEDDDYEDSFDPILTDVINLFHEYNLKTMLPAAYASYLCKYSLRNLLRNDRILRKAKDQCIIGHANIVNFVKTVQTGCLCPCIIPSPGCKSWQCANEKWTIINSVPAWKVDRRLPILAPALKEDSTLGKCSQCWGVFESYSRKVRGELWEKLPGFFELGEQ